MRDAAAVFALCQGCAALLLVLFDPRWLFNLSLAFGCVVGVGVATSAASFLSRLSASAPRGPVLKLIACGAGIGVVTLVAMAAAEARRVDLRGLAESLNDAGVHLPWHSWLRVWLNRVLPQGALLFVVAGAFAAWLFPRVSCTKPA